MPGDPDPRRPRAVRAWEAAFGAPPSRYLSVAFLEKAVAHEAQCRMHGGVPAATRRALTRIAGGDGVGASVPRVAKAGAHLVREWNGRTYRVEVVEDGYRMDGRTWRSLSGLARHITGTSWSGPRFFGLSKRRAGQAGRPGRAA